MQEWNLAQPGKKVHNVLLKKMLLCVEIITYRISRYSVYVIILYNLLLRLSA